MSACSLLVRLGFVVGLLSSMTVQGQTIAADVYEGDNTQAQAKPLLLDGNAQQRNFHLNGDTDWFSFELQPGQTATVSPRPATVQTNRWRLDAYRVTVGGNVSVGTLLFGATTTAQMTVTNSSAGTESYVGRIAASGALFSGAPSKYTLTGTVSGGGAGVAPDAFEPNNTRETAQALNESQGWQSHNFHVAGDEDWSTYFLGQGLTGHVTVEPVTPTATSSWQVTLKTVQWNAATGSWEVIDAAPTATLGPQSATVSGAATISGGQGFWVHTRSISGSFSGSATAYRIRVTTSVTPSQTISVTASPNTNLVAPASTRLTATVSAGAAVQSVVFRQNGSQICSPVTVAPYICDWNQISAGSYNVTAHATLTSGTIDSVALPLTVSSGGSPDAGNTWSTATSILGGQPQDHQFEISNDRDWFVYSLAPSQGSTVTVTPLTSQATARWEARLYVRESGQSIQSTPIRVAQLSSQPVVWSGLNSLTGLDRAYYIEVAPIDSDFYGSQSSYRVSVVGAPFGGTSTCTVSDWSTAAGTPVAGEPDDSFPVPRYRGRCGIQADAMGDYLIDQLPSAESAYKVRFQYYTGNRSGGTADIFQARNASSVLLRVTHDGNQLGFSVSGSATSRSVVVADNRWYSIQLEWSTGAGSGGTTIRVVGAGSPTPLAVAAIVDANNANDRIEEARLGLISGAGTGTVGFDDFESRRLTLPARRCRGDANNDGAISLGDLTTIANEINNAGQAFAPGQPDANEDGIVDAADVAVVQAAIGAAFSCAQM